MMVYWNVFGSPYPEKSRNGGKLAAQEKEAAEHALHHKGFTPLGLFARLGKVGIVDAVHRLLQESADQLVGRFALPPNSPPPPTGVVQLPAKIFRVIL